MDKRTQQELITRRILERKDDAVEYDAEWAEFEAELADSAELQTELMAFQNAAQSLAYSIEPVPMAADLKDRLMGKINRSRKLEVMRELPDALAELLDVPIEQLQAVADRLDNWQAFPAPAIGEMAVWQLDKAANQVAFFVRATASGLFPNHYHAEGETVLVLDGDFSAGDETYRAGDVVYSPGNTSHQPHTTEGCLVFCISSIDDEILTE